MKNLLTIAFLLFTLNLNAQMVYVTGGGASYGNTGVSSFGWGIGLSTTENGLKISAGYAQKRAFADSEKEIEQIDNYLQLSIMKGWVTKDMGSDGYLALYIGGFMDMDMDVKGGNDAVGESSTVGGIGQLGLHRKWLDILLDVHIGINKQVYAGVLVGVPLKL
jgi:hypothetical protein